VVESTCPVDGNICLLLTVKHWTTLTSLHLFAVFRHVVWSDRPQELDVVVTVVFCHLFTTGFVCQTHIDLHFPVQSIIQKEVVCHADPVGHRDAQSWVFTVIVIANFFLCSLRQRHFTPITSPIRAPRFLSCTGSSR
uniref:Uncharacterized protein n=1 Tax=Echeneis naucrates TaxID=173247 RepID=A0A665UG91_ECHNA